MIKEFKNWTYKNGFKPNKYEVLKQFVDGVKNGDLVACSVCGEYNDKLVCKDCERNGN